MKLIPLTQGRFAMVDDEDCDWLNQFKWYYDGRYASSKSKIIKGKKFVRMHSLILNTPKGMGSDHRDHNGLNNQRYNIRVCTAQQNNMNAVNRKNCSSGYKGVGWTKRDEKWRSRIRMDGKEIHLGYFVNEKDAAFAYNQKAIELFGEFAYLNKI